MFDVTFDGVLMSVRCRFGVRARVSGVAISVDVGVDISVDIGVDINAVINVDICVPIGVDSWTSKHIKSFDGGLMLDRGSRVRF